MLIFMVAVGGGIGAVARYGVGGWVQGFSSTSFPLGTLAVNVLGSFLLGLSFYLLESLAVSAETRAMVTMGFLGSFTTFSTFSYEAIVLLEGGEWARGGMYLGGSLALGLMGVIGGLALGSLLLHARG
ncbi:MAG: fluoride efflux transporter CrcB [Longimicrobiales bacterium]